MRMHAATSEWGPTVAETPAPHPTCLETTTVVDLASRTRTFVCGPECPRPAGPDPERDKRIDVYRDRERRRAARALDRYLEDYYLSVAPATDRSVAVAGERFVEAVGDYVLARLEGGVQGQVDRIMAARDGWSRSDIDYPLPAHLLQEFNATGNMCHYPGCALSADEHGEDVTAHGASQPHHNRHYGAPIECTCKGDDKPHDSGLRGCIYGPGGVLDGRDPLTPPPAQPCQDEWCCPDCGHSKAVAARSGCQTPDAHAETNPCSNGRCSDPEAHAEGAHDL
jgi:hypothetical protein